MNNTYLSCVAIFVTVVATQTGCDSGRKGSSPDALTDATGANVDAAGQALLEVDCRPDIAERGLFESRCQYLGASKPNEVVVACTHVAEAGSAGQIILAIHKADMVTVGQPIALGGVDPIVSLSVTSSSVRESNLVQQIDGTEAGTVIFDRFQEGVIVSGRFISVTFQRGPVPPAPTCVVHDGTFVADQGPGVGAP